MTRAVKIIRGKKEVQVEIGLLEIMKFPVSINWAIHIYKHKFLWKEWKTYDYFLQVLYIHKSKYMMSVTETNTNTMLDMIASEVRFDIKQKIEIMKMEDQKKMK